MSAPLDIFTGGTPSEPTRGPRGKKPGHAEPAQHRRRQPAPLFQPFPVDALPDPIRQFVQLAAKAIGCDPTYVALPLLSAVAAAIGNTRRVQPKHNWSEPPTLWTIIIGQSGTEPGVFRRIVAVEKAAGRGDAGIPAGPSCARQTFPRRT